MPNWDETSLEYEPFSEVDVPWFNPLQLNEEDIESMTIPALKVFEWSMESKNISLGSVAITILKVISNTLIEQSRVVIQANEVEEESVLRRKLIPNLN